MSLEETQIIEKNRCPRSTGNKTKNYMKGENQMKKVLFPILALVLAIGLALPVAAHTEASPYIVDLIADGGSSATATDVGNVSVWNDGDKLHVKYEITDLDWIITETHLYAGKNVSPTSAPGQFPYDDDDAASVSDTVVTYAIPLDDIDAYSMQVNKKGKPTGVMIADGTPGVGPCNDVYIATHAVVVKETTTELVTNGGFETPEVTAVQGWDIFDSPAGGWMVDWWGGSTSYGGQARPDPAHLELHEGVNGWLPYEGDQHAELDTDWDGPGGGLTNEPASVEISQTLAACPSGNYTLRYAWSPRPSHSDNALQVLWDGSVIASHSGAGSSNTNWVLEEHEYLSGPSSGTVTLALRETGTPDSLGMFLDSVSVTCTEVEEETAWGDGMRFEGRNNWAMQFPYHIQPPCPFHLIGNTMDIGWGLREKPEPVAQPNSIAVTFTGAVNASGLQDNGAVFIGLVDKQWVDDGNSGWMGGAYAYFGRRGNNLCVGPTDGNFGGEIVQTFRAYADYFSSPTLISFTMVIDNGSVTVTLDSTDYVDTYGEIKALNSKTAYAWDEFEYGAYIAVDTWPYGTYGVNDVSYDVLVDWCGE
jgi:hypothetical protein